jgi:hypothetical protein
VLGVKLGLMLGGGDIIECDYHFAVRNTKVYKISKLQTPVFQKVYDILYPNFTVELNL